MELINKDSIEQLLTNQSTPAVTIYIPMLTSAAPPHLSENQIRLKNMIHQACEQLESNDEGQRLAKQLEEARERLSNDMAFWKNQTPGLLICAAPGNIQMFHLPVDTEEYVAIDDAFHLAPVLALVNDQREYYVLSLAQQHPTLYKGDIYGLADSGIALPVDAGVALGIDEPNQKSENQGSATAPSANTGWFNGRGGARNPQDQDRIRFFRLINHIIMTNLDRKTPLILAGVDSDISEFRLLSKYPAILQGTIPGNHNGQKPEDLFQAARQIIWDELVVPEHQAAIAEYQQVQGTNPDRVASDMKSLEAAAEQGRVDKLLARMMRQTTDTVQDNMTATQRITFPEQEQSKRINRLVMKVHQMSGKVISLMPNEMPDGAPMVARLRY